MDNYITPTEFARQVGWDVTKVYSLAKDKDNPLPIHYPKGSVRSGFCIVKELNEWIENNTNLYLDRK